MASLLRSNIQDFVQEVPVSQMAQGTPFRCLPPRFQGVRRGKRVKPPKCPTRQSGLADTYTYACIQLFILFMRTFVYMCVYIYRCVYLYIYISSHIFICIFEYMYIYIYTHMYIYMYIYTHMHTLRHPPALNPHGDGGDVVRGYGVP